MTSETRLLRLMYPTYSLPLNKKLNKVFFKAHFKRMKFFALVVTMGREELDIKQRGVKGREVYVYSR
jgi:hypothetical protein